MCSSSPVKEKDQQEKKSATSTSCCPGSFSRTRKVARALVKRLHTNPCKMYDFDLIRSSLNRVFLEVICENLRIRQKIMNVVT